jgi:hypothetical protein
MNDLEPWKIWAITAVLVCAIFGTAAARVRSQTVGDPSAQAAEVTSGEDSASVATASPHTAADQYEVYPSYVPHRSFSSAGYSGVQASSIIPLTNLLYGPGPSSGIETENDQEPVLDVARQLLGNEASQAASLAANDDQTETNQVQVDMFTDVPQDHWAYAAVQDTPMDVTLDFTSPNGEALVFSDPSDPPEAQAFDLALQNVIVNTAVMGPDSSGAVNLLQRLGGGYGTAASQTYELGSQAVNPEIYQGLALTGELAEELGDEGDFANEQQNEAVLAEAKALVVAQAQAQLQEAMRQQQVEAIYRLNVGSAVIQLNDVQFSMPPEE